MENFDIYIKKFVASFLYVMVVICLSSILTIPLMILGWFSTALLCLIPGTECGGLFNISWVDYVFWILLYGYLAFLWIKLIVYNGILELKKSGNGNLLSYIVCCVTSTTGLIIAYYFCIKLDLPIFN